MQAPAVRCIAAATAMFFSNVTTGTTVVEPSFRELVKEADQIVAVSVTRTAAQWKTNLNESVIMTTVTFAVEDVVKGKQAETISLDFLGGTVGATTMDVTGAPVFKVGERAILFISPNRNEVCPLIGMYCGRFRVERDKKTRQDIVVRHDGRLVLSDLNIQQTAHAPAQALPLRPITTSEFKQRIRDEAATKSQKN
jgi:hypothetical protein